MGVVEQPIQQGGAQGLVVGKCRGPLPERQVAGQDDAAFLLALGHDVEEQGRLLAPEGQIADLIDDQQLGADDSVGCWLHHASASSYPGDQ